MRILHSQPVPVRLADEVRDAPRRATVPTTTPATMPEKATTTMGGKNQLTTLSEGLAELQAWRGRGGAGPVKAHARAGQARPLSAHNAEVARLFPHLTHPQRVTLAYQRWCAEQAGAELPVAGQERIALLEWLGTGKEQVGAAIATIGADAVYRDIKEWLQQLAQSVNDATVSPADPAKAIPIASPLGQVERDMVRMGQRERDVATALAPRTLTAQEKTEQELPSVSIAGVAGRNQTERVCLALKQNGYGHLGLAELVTLASKVQRAGKVTG